MSDPLLWSSPAWLEEATDWVDARLATAGARRTGRSSSPTCARGRPRCASPRRRRGLAEGGGRPGRRYEIALYELLAARGARARARPAGGRRRARLGPAARRRHAAGRPRAGPRDSPPRCATCSRSTRSCSARWRRAREEILALGAPDMRPQVMPQRFEQALEATAGARGSQRRSRAARRAPRGRGGVVRPARGRRPARSAWTTTTCTPGTSSAPARSASTTGATASSRTRSRACCSRSPTCATGPTSDGALRLRDAYLEAWSDLAPHAELVETLELAVRVGWIARSHTWLRAVGDATEDRWATAPLESLAAIL